MRRIAFTCAVLLAAATGFAASAGADDTHTYEIEMYNAFGIVEGSDVRISGVNAGQVTDLDINAAKRAVVSIELAGDLGTLGEDTTCSSEPQSLIAEYFIDCEPKGSPLDDGATITADRVSQTVQADLVQNTLREPFKRRLQLIINEFGTALAGNAEALNEAIRLGAPALRDLKKVTGILADQNQIITDLNVNSDRVIGQLNERSEDVVRFIKEARDTAAASAERRVELSRNFEILDDFVFELRPTLADLENLAREQTPLLADLRAAAPGLNTLATNLPAFNRASQASLESLGDASIVGEKALRRGRDEIRQLAEAGKKAPIVSEMLADLLRDLDDPRRAVEIDDRVTRDTGRDNPQPGQRDTRGYTGLEGLLNYVYYQPGAINQFDQVGHLLHFSLYFINSGPCGAFSSGRDPDTGEPGLPAESGGTTTNLLEAADCVASLGKNIPGVNDLFDLPKFNPAVCPNGTEPERAREELCDPADPAAGPAPATARVSGAGRSSGAGGPEPAPPPSSDGPLPDNVLEDILDLPEGSLDPGADLDDLPDGVGEQLDELGQGTQQGLEDVRRRLGGKGARNGGGGGGGQLGGGGATEDLLDFLFSG